MSAAPRVLMVVHHRYPLDPRVLREARIAVERGYEVEVVALRGEGESAREDVDGVRVWRLPISHERSGGVRRMLGEYLGFLLGATLVVALRGLHRPRELIVHVHTPPDFLAFAALLPKLAGARVILDIHDLSPLLFGERFRGNPAAPLLVRGLEWVQALACRLADRVVTVHRPYVDALIASGVPEAKLRMVMNAADESLIAAARAQAADGREDFTVAYHGTITPAYGVELLVDGLAAAAPSLSQMRAIILGDGDALAGVTERARELGIAERVEFSGRYLPVPEALSRVASADCGVIPNPDTELNRLTLSTKLLEYVALGVPAVVARLETLAAHFSDEEVTFFAPGDPEALAEAIRWVALNPEEAAAKAERAQVRAQEYSWQRARQSYAGVLAELSA